MSDSASSRFIPLVFSFCNVSFLVLSKLPLVPLVLAVVGRYEATPSCFLVDSLGLFYAAHFEVLGPGLGFLANYLTLSSLIKDVSIVDLD